MNPIPKIQTVVAVADVDRWNREGAHQLVRHADAIECARCGGYWDHSSDIVGYRCYVHVPTPLIIRKQEIASGISRNMAAAVSNGGKCTAKLHQAKRISRKPLIGTNT